MSLIVIRQGKGTLSVDDIPKTECALDIPGSVCSTLRTVKDMEQLVVERNNKSDPVMILEEAKKVLNCGTEKCVLTHPKFKSISQKEHIEESLDNLKPAGPANSTALLNNNNIDEVLRKLSKVHTKFYHHPYQMIDFAGVRDGDDWKIIDGQKISPTSLGKLNIAEIAKNKEFNTFGVVMNTDVRTGGGIHWFSLFCDFRKEPATVEYFNSSGKLPVRQIQEWVHTTVAKLNENSIKAKSVILHGTVHQTASETECGLYSIYYIWNRLNGVQPSDFQESAVHDSKMIKFRKSVFT